MCDNFVTDAFEWLFDDVETVVVEFEFEFELAVDDTLFAFFLLFVALFALVALVVLFDEDETLTLFAG